MQKINKEGKDIRSPLWYKLGPIFKPSFSMDDRKLSSFHITCRSHKGLLIITFHNHYPHQFDAIYSSFELELDLNLSDFALSLCACVVPFAWLSHLGILRV